MIMIMIMIMIYASKRGDYSLGEKGWGRGCDNSKEVGYVSRKRGIACVESTTAARKNAKKKLIICLPKFYRSL